MKMVEKVEEQFKKDQAITNQHHEARCETVKDPSVSHTMASK